MALPLPLDILIIQGQVKQWLATTKDPELRKCLLDTQGNLNTLMTHARRIQKKRLTMR